MKHEELTAKIIGIFYKVYNALGYGFLEKVYENALAFEFNKSGLSFVKQARINVLYEGEVMGEYFADFIVEDRVIVEVKAIARISSKDENQLLNYLTATDKEVGLLLNFGEEAEKKRKIYDNERKVWRRG